jgi:hypothetical protein
MVPCGRYSGDISDVSNSASVSCDAQEISREAAKRIEQIERDRGRAWRYESEWAAGGVDRKVHRCLRPRDINIKKQVLVGLTL